MVGLLAAPGAAPSVERRAVRGAPRRPWSDAPGGHLRRRAAVGSRWQPLSGHGRPPRGARGVRNRVAYRTDSYPPGTPFGERTTCQSWFFRARKPPAEVRR